MLNPAMKKILDNLDVKTARPMFKSFGFPPAMHVRSGRPVEEDEVILCAMHKARLTQPKAFSGEQKRASREWLIEHGYTSDI